ncbi:MAG: TadE/TadG family type IV pilus assembly protein [Variibacter sp.]
MTKLHKLIATLRGKAAALAHENSGLAAIEFAMLLPLMVVLFLGCAEVSQAVGIDRKVGLTTRTVSDLVAQVKSVSDSDMSNIMAAVAAVAAPYPTSNLRLKVSSITIDANKVAKIAWGDAMNTSARQKGDVVIVPNGLLIANTTLIWAEATYNFTPTIGYVITGTLPLSDQIYMRPRLSDCVQRPPSVTGC